MIFRHKKTGQHYRRLASGTDCSNARDGTPVVVYRREADPAGPVFVREEDEFYEMLEGVDPASVNDERGAPPK